MELRFGNGAVPCPTSWRDLPVFAPRELPPLVESVAAVRRALVPCVAGGGRIAVVLPDASRPIPSEVVDAVLGALREHGGRPVVRFANGTHRQTTAGERARTLGRHADLPAGDRSCDDAAAHARLGDLDGEPAGVDSALLQAERLVLVGPMAFHYLAGVGGAGKLIAPGCADRCTARAIHARCLGADGRRHPKARTGVVDANPVQDGIDQVAARAPPAIAVAPVLDGSGLRRSREMTRVCSPKVTHRKGSVCWVRCLQ